MNSKNDENTDRNMSRVARNHDLYQEINNGELDSFSVRSNATVIGNQEPEIDIEKIKKILDTKYNTPPKRKSIRIEPREKESKLLDDLPTKEYDLNVILEKAKDEKEETYEEARAKKLRNTQFDILKNLNIEEKKISEKETAEDNLMELINTITINEAKKKEENAKDEIDPLDLLEDLKGNENTEVYERMTEDISNIMEEEKKEIDKEKNKNENVNSNLDNSFYTNNLFKKKDFEDNNDFVDDDKGSIIVKVLVFLVIVAFLVGLFIFLKEFLNF